MYRDEYLTFITPTSGNIAVFDNSIRNHWHIKCVDQFIAYRIVKNFQLSEIFNNRKKLSPWPSEKNTFTLNMVTWLGQFLQKSLHSFNF